MNNFLGMPEGVYIITKYYDFEDLRPQLPRAAILYVWGKNNIKIGGVGDKGGWGIQLE